MDTSNTQSSIDETLARFVKKIDSFEQNVQLPADIRVPIEFNNQMYEFKCKVRKLEPGIHLYLGMDFHYFHPFTLSINRVHVNSRQFWAMEHHNDIEYVYNHHRGQNLRRKLESLQMDNFKAKYFREF